MLKRPVLVIIMGCLPTWRAVCVVMFLCENVLQRAQDGESGEGEQLDKQNN